MKSGIFLTAASFLFAGISVCQGGGTEVVADANLPRVLEDYLREAALNNAGLKGAFEQWKAAVGRVEQAGSLPDPRFTYGYFIREVETRVGAQRHKFGLSQVFPWSGKIEARRDAAAAEAKGARKRYEAAKLKLFFEVKEAFHEYAYLARAVEIANENLELVKHFEEVARAKYVAAAASHPDVIRAQVELARLEDRLRSLERLREPIAARLNSILNRKDSAMLPWPERGEFRAAKVERKQMLESLRAWNPELQGLSFEVQSAKSRLKLAEKESYPDIGVGLDWIETDEALARGTRDSGKDPIVLMFTLNLPVWRESYEAAEIEARARMRMASQQRIEAENSLVARAERVLYDFEDSVRKARLYGDVLVPKAEELLSASEVAYKAGSVSFLSLTDAERMLLEYELLYERSVTDHGQRLAELEMLAGRGLAVTYEGGSGE
jgi:cobalt-zinc-cadmium efflux system outer membrane protein